MEMPALRLDQKEGVTTGKFPNIPVPWAFPRTLPGAASRGGRGPSGPEQWRRRAGGRRPLPLQDGGAEEESAAECEWHLPPLRAHAPPRWVRGSPRASSSPAPRAAVWEGGGPPALGRWVAPLSPPVPPQGRGSRPARVPAWSAIRTLG